MIYKVMVYDRRDDSEYCLEKYKVFNDARKLAETLKRFVTLYADLKSFENLYFYVQDENGNSVY